MGKSFQYSLKLNFSKHSTLGGNRLKWNTRGRERSGAKLVSVPLPRNSTWRWPRWRSACGFSAWWQRFVPWGQWFPRPSGRPWAAPPPRQGARRPPRPAEPSRLPAPASAHRTASAAAAPPAGGSGTRPRTAPCWAGCCSRVLGNYTQTKSTFRSDQKPRFSASVKHYHFKRQHLVTLVLHFIEIYHHIMGINDIQPQRLRWVNYSRVSVIRLSFVSPTRFYVQLV